MCVCVQLKEKEALKRNEDLQLKRETTLVQMQNAEIERQEKERQVSQIDVVKLMCTMPVTCYASYLC